MIERPSAASQWARRVAMVRKQSHRAAPAGAIDEALDMCDVLLRELAGAHLALDRLRGDLRAAETAWDRLFEVMPAACVLTNQGGSILKANRAAGALLNVAPAHLKGRPLLVFAEDRETFRALLTEIGRNGSTQLRARVMLRPRERKPAPTQLQVLPSPRDEQEWFWIVTPEPGAPT